MDKQEIIEGNRLICIVDGWTIEPGMENDPDPYYNRGFSMVMLSEMGYHKDWNWIMAIVEKIETSADQDTGHIEIHIIENWCRIYRMSYTKELIKVYDPKSKIAAVWQAVVQYLQWLNSQKQ